MHKYFTLSLSALFICLGCTIIPEDSFDKLPTASLESITVNREDGKNLKGNISYEGDVTNPSKIIIDWDNGFRLLQIPITDTVGIIKRTVYEIQNKKISKIININDAELEVRIENFTYNNKGYLTMHTLLENRTNGHATYENLFFYKALGGYDEFDSVYQTRCIPTGCVNGFFEGTISIMPYDNALPYFNSSTLNSSDSEPSNFESNNDKSRSYFEFVKGQSNSFYNSSVRYYNAQSGAYSYLHFSEIYEPIPSGYYEYESEYDYWGYKRNQSTPSIELSFGKLEYVLNLYYYIGNYLLPAQIKEDDEYYSYEIVSPYGNSSLDKPTFWILSRLSLPIEQYNFVVPSKQKFINKERHLSFRFNLKFE